MRRAIIIALTLVLGFAISFLVFSLYNNHEEVITYDDFIYDQIDVDGDGNFVGRFQIVKKTHRICGYKYETKDNVLYISLIATAGNKETLPVCEDGYVEIEFSTDSSVEKIVYKCGKSENELDWFRS